MLDTGKLLQVYLCFRKSNSSQIKFKYKYLLQKRDALVAISVPDIDQTIKWYEDKLGFKLQNRRKVSTGIEIALIEKNGFYIDIIRIANSKNVEGAPKDPPEHLSIQGLRNIVFWVDNLKATDAQLKARGVQLIWESRFIPEVNTSVTNFRDNNGN